MEQRLMILGSLTEFIELVKQAKARGIYTVVCDGYENGPAKQYADKAYNIDVRKVDEIVEVIKKERINGIMGTFSDLLFEQICFIADKAGLKWYVKPEMVPYYREKPVAKALLRDLGVRVPKNVVIRKDFKDSELNGFTFPVVIKPINGYGSKGIYVVKSIDEIRRKYDDVSIRSTFDEILVEEYSRGREYNLMCWVADGVVRPISIADREKNPSINGQLPVLNRVAYPAKAIKQVLPEALEVLQKFIGVTKQDGGPISMQFFYNENGVEVCEIAGRMFGYEHELVTLCSGLDVEKLLLDYVYDEETSTKTIKAHNPYFTKHYAGLYFVGEQDKIIFDQSSGKELAKNENVIEAIFFYEDGEVIDNYGPKPYFSRFYITGKTRKDVDRLTDNIYQNYTVKDADGNEILVRHILEK